MAKWNAHFSARPHLIRKFDRADFGFYLASAWHEAKSGQMTAEARRVDTIRAEIDGLKFKSLRVNIEPRRRILEAELSSIAA
ncbi:hypothetical protein DBIPINDM_001578 [Mesorhizobium sp. AR02]|uniref:hypothetical protein n=1 Tax=Mesorhizobium sp. AR02 TaxID=2865837 RepID=UPI00215EF95D|nr:hypothetical protein [Mesorhizobium sp. AR02]UVK55088.1 hypothetical protein DBIPINDM_001578 [Mesorhizobium sp. AR02]